MTASGTPLAAVVTTDLAAITRGRFVAADRLEALGAAGVGWLPANLALTAFDAIAMPNPWGSSGDLRISPEFSARYRSTATGAATPFDMVMGDIVALDGAPWPGCTRTFLKEAAARLQAETGLSVRASFEQEFQLFDAGLPRANALSVQALRRAEPFASHLFGALAEAGIEPEVVIAEFGQDQFEVTCAPAAPAAAADRAVAIREIAREVARTLGWRASFAPKTALGSVGNGVHIHFSLVDAQARPVMHDPSAPGGLSAPAAGFCAGVLRHMPALLALTAPSIPSYYRLRPQNWSASYTWLAERDREAALRICPTTTIGGRDPALQFNIEYRAADATSNPYLALGALLLAGLQGLREALALPPLTATHPDRLAESERRTFGVHRLPATLEQALDALTADPVASKWLAPDVMACLLGVRRSEMTHLAGLDPQAICDQYRAIY